MSAYISQLAVYPLKSAAAIAIEQVALSPFGLQWDRRWLLIDEEGKFVTQRQYPSMALIQVQVIDDVLQVNAPNMPKLIAVPHQPYQVTASVWQDTVLALTVSEDADAWFSQFLGFAVRLVFFPDTSQRTVDQTWAGEGHQTAFSDGFPLLVISQATLDDISQRWGKGLDWRRFRPNMIVSGDFAPYSEDTWQTLTIGDTKLALVKPCSRCIIPSINPQTAAKDSGFNRMLNYRRQEDGKIYVGQNAIISHSTADARLSIGQTVQIVTY